MKLRNPLLWVCIVPIAFVAGSYGVGEFLRLNFHDPAVQNGLRGAKKLYGDQNQSELSAEVRSIWHQHEARYGKVKDFQVNYSIAPIVGGTSSVEVRVWRTKGKFIESSAWFGSRCFGLSIETWDPTGKQTPTYVTYGAKAGR